MVARRTSLLLALALVACTTEVSWTIDVACELTGDPPPVRWAITSGACTPIPGEPIAQGIAGVDAVPDPLSAGTYCFWGLSVEESAADDSCRLLAIGAETRELPAQRDTVALSLACVEETERPVWDRVVERLAGCAPACDAARCECPGGASCAELRCEPPLEADLVALGPTHACAGRRGTATVRCWGERSGFLIDGTGTTDLPEEVRFAGAGTAVFVEGSAGRGVTCGRSALGAVACVGEAAARWTSPVRVSAGDALLIADSIDAGDRFACAIGFGGAGARARSVYCWGSAAEGRLATLDDADHAAAEEIATMEPFEVVTAGRAHACVLAQGEIRCWGANTSGQADPSAPSARVLPTLVPHPIAPWFRVAAGGDHTCAVDASASVYCWGQGIAGVECVAGSCTAEVGTASFFDVSVGTTHICAADSATYNFLCADSADLQRSVSVLAGYSMLIAGDGVSCGLLASEGTGTVVCRPWSASVPYAPGILGNAHTRAGSEAVCP